MKQFSLQEYLENPQRKIVTRNGDKIRIICTDKKSTGYPIVALLEYSDENTTNKEAVMFYNEKGKINLCNNNVDLFFATEDEEKNDTSTTTAKITQGGTSMKQFNLKDYLHNPQRKIVTKDDRNVRIICTDRRGLNAKPIAALITLPDGDEVIKTYWEDGVETRGYEGCPNDLFFVTEKKTKWLNIYTDNDENPIAGCFFETEEEAIENISTGYTYIDTIKIEVEE